MKNKNIDKMPNQKWHQIVSFFKSLIRIFGYALLPINIFYAAGVLAISEMLGILEELV